MSTIRILPEQVASQIAAGEVIDRPASVIRELLDNSIDAEADRIRVSIERGGKASVKVSDNGRGMSRDDLLLCVERHATSKIHTAEDLFSIRSLGFRGEALPAMASVSRLQITTRLHDQVVGHRLQMAGGKFVSMEEAGSPPGTRVEVRDLFYNVPARRKFLRADKTETDHILDTFSRIALPYPGIGFHLESNGKQLLNFPPSERPRERFSAVLGRKVAEALVEMELEHPELTIHGYLAPPEFTRSRGDRLFIFVNGRNVRDRLIAKAVVEGYGQRIMKGRYPQAVLFVTIEPSQVDVNVHPAKQEVRFRGSQNVFRGIASGIEGALSRHFRLPFGGLHGGKEPQVHPQESVGFVSERAASYFPQSSGPQEQLFAAVDQPFTLGERPRVIGQLGDTYILCEVKDGFLLVDQHAAHERIVYEELQKSYCASRMEMQGFLVPYNLELGAKEARIVAEKEEEFQRLGIQLEHFGGNSFLLRSAPALLRNVQWDTFIADLTAELEHGALEDQALLHKALTVVACHGAIRAGERMSFDEMSHLLEQLEEMDLPTNCPHGRPIFKHFTYGELERMFKRVL